VVELPAVLTGYLEALVDALGKVEAVYVIGSAASGAYHHGPSDVDVVAVVPHALSTAEKEELVARAERVECPARGLELVVYAKGTQPPEYEINFNAGSGMPRHVSFDPAHDAWHWFVVDASIAKGHAVPLVGPPWLELFEPIPPERVRAAVRDVLAWAEESEPEHVNAERARHYLATGEWRAKG